VRLKYALFVLLFTTPFIVAQEEPLPLVTARTAIPEVMLIATAVEPIRDFRAPTLAEAARLNDFATFDALYREAPDARFATLHELWTYAMTNPIGSFYDQAMYERLARAYPGYAEFIDQHRIVDSRGNVFYPTTETRTFVLERAMEGRAPRVMVAVGDTPGPPKPAPVVATVQPAGGLRARRSTRTEAPAVAVEPSPVERRALSPSAPVVVAEVPAVAPVVETAPAAEAAAAPQVAVQQQPAPVTTPTPAPLPAVQPESTSSARGLLLIVIGLLGVGLLAVMFRTPQQTMPPIIDVKPQEKPAAPVEPLKRPEAPQQPAAKNRATGSHG